MVLPAKLQCTVQSLTALKPRLLRLVLKLISCTTAFVDSENVAGQIPPLVHAAVFAPSLKQLAIFNLDSSTFGLSIRLAVLTDGPHLKPGLPF